MTDIGRSNGEKKVSTTPWGDSLLQTRVLISNVPAEVFSLRFSPDGSLLAAGCGDGVARVYHAASGRLIAEAGTPSVRSMPATCVCWHPRSSAAKPVLAIAGADGRVSHWSVAAAGGARLVHELTETTANDERNEVYSIAYSSDGTRFATGGRDRCVRVYDAASRTQIVTLARGFGDASGHSNRIFAVKFHPDDSNVVYSAGFDHTVQIWSIRAGRSTRSVFGVVVTGQALDVVHTIDNGVLLLTGSARPTEQLELWDAVTADRVGEIAWGGSQPVEGGDSACSVYGAAFGMRGALLAAGSSGPNIGKVFYRKSGEVLGAVQEETPIYTVDFTPNGRAVAFGTAGGTIRVCVLSPSAAKLR